MGAYFGSIAIKTKDSDKVLDTLEKYYQKRGLSLNEVSVGDGETKYTTERYKNISEFQDLYRPRKEGKHVEYSTEFDFYFNLEKNKDWLVLQYDLKMNPMNSLDIDNDLVRLLSKELSAEVVSYYRYDVVNSLEIRKYVKGELVDRFSVDDLQIDEDPRGFFERFKIEEFADPYELRQEAESSYLEQNGLDFEDEELEMYYAGHWRRFYLGGSREKIEEYLVSI